MGKKSNVFSFTLNGSELRELNPDSISDYDTYRQVYITARSAYHATLALYALNPEFAHMVDHRTPYHLQVHMKSNPLAPKRHKTRRFWGLREAGDIHRFANKGKRYSYSSVRPAL